MTIRTQHRGRLSSAHDDVRQSLLLTLVGILAPFAVVAAEPISALDALPPVASGTRGGDLTDRLNAITRQMEQARDQLAQRDTGPVTQDVQTQILAELDALLEMPPESPMPNSPGGGSSQPQNSQPQNSRDQAGSRPQDGKKNSQTGDAANRPENVAQQSTPQNRSTAEDSEERSDPRTATTTPLLPRRRMEVDVWGHLPEHMRDRLMNAYGERVVPQYEDLIQRFYRSLAESGSKDRP